MQRLTFNRVRAAGPSDPTFFGSSAMRAAMSAGRLTDPFRQHLLTYRACHMIAMNIAALHLYCWTGGPEEEDRARVQNDAVMRLLQKPNPETRRHGFIYNTIIHMLTTGESWMFLRDVAGNQLLGVVDQPRWILQASRSGVICERLTSGGVRYLDAKTREELDPQSNLQIKLEDPFDRYRGLSPLDVGRMEIETDWDSARYNKAFFENAAIPDGVLSTPQSLTDPQRNTLRAQFEERHRGVRNAHRLAVLSNGLTFERMGDSHREMEYIEGRKFSREQLQILLGTPESELGVTKDTKYNNGITGNRGLWSQTLLPMMEIFESAVNDPDNGLAMRFDPTRRIYIGFDMARIREVMDAISDKLDQATKLWEMGVPLNAINERLGLGLPTDIKGADQAWISAGVQTVENGSESQTPETPASAEETSAEAIQRGYRGRWQSRAAMVRSVQSEVEALWSATERAMLPKVLSWMKDYRREMLNRVDAEATKSAKDEAQFKAPASVDSLILNRAAADDFLLDQKQWHARLVAKMQKDYDKAIRGAAKTVEKELGGLQVYQTGHPAVAAFKKTLADKVSRVSKTIRGQLKKSLAEGLKQGETVAELKDRVRSVMNAAAGRAKTIARTEAGSAINGGRYRVMKLEGVAGTEWSAMIDDRTRDSHIEINGERRKLGKKFSNGLYYPMQTGAPANEVINCRCVGITLEADEMKGTDHDHHEADDDVRAAACESTRSHLLRRLAALREADRQWSLAYAPGAAGRR